MMEPTEETQNTIEKLKELLDSEDISSLINFMDNSHPADIAEIFGLLELRDAIHLFRLTDEYKQMLIFKELDEILVSNFVEILSLNELSPIIEKLESDDVTSVLEELSKEKTEALLSKFSKEDSIRIRLQMNFAENTAGRLMTNDFAVVKANENASVGIENIRKAAKHTENIYVIYVTDEKGVVKGYVKLKDLLLAPHTTKIFRMMKPIKTIHYDTDQEEVAHFFKKYDIVSAPVIDDDGRIIGRVTVDDILDVVEEEATEDMLKMAGVGEHERLNTPIWASVKKRIIWLQLNLFTATLSASVVTLFEDTIHKMIVLATLMPIVAGLGGNAGTQSITMVVRNIATGEINNLNLWNAVRKEFSIGVLNGIFLGSITACATYLIKGDFRLSIVIGLAMVINLTAAGLVGSMAPIILRFLKIDPAVASSIFVTTCTDILGFFTFLGLATLFIAR